MKMAKMLTTVQVVLCFMVMSICLPADAASTSSTYINGKVMTTGKPLCPYGGFYGYQKTGVGPGADAFQNCLNKCKDEHKLMMVIYCTDSCSSCSAFAKAVNDASRSTMQIGQDTINGYFRGTDSASLEAKAFFDLGKTADDEGLKSAGGAKGSCHIIGFYGVCEDGTKYKASDVLVTSNWDNFFRQYYKYLDAWRKLAEKHLYTPPKGSSGFACGALEMVSNVTQSVYVPFTRTNNLTNIETNWLRVTYPDSVTTNIAFIWAGTGPAATNLEIAVDVSTVTNVGDRVRLEYLNTNQVSLATNWITCVTAKNGTLMSPGLPGAKASEDLAWGEWTLDFAAATNKSCVADGCTFAILGSPVWSKTAYDIFGESDATFVKFCTDNKMTMVVVDVEDAAGSSLFSHKIAATGRSGTSFLSRNGLCTTNEDVVAMKAALAEVDAAYRKAPAGTAEFVLIRADGTVAGRFAPYTGAGAATENSYRMAELLQLLADPNEELNNDPATTPVAMTVAYGNESPSNTLHVSDSKDVFLVSGVPAAKPVRIALGMDKILEGAGVAMTVVAFTNVADRSQYREVKPALDGVWVFSAAEAASLGVIVSAWKDGTENAPYNGDSTIHYAVRAEAAPANAGEIFFEKEEDNVLINEGLDYAFAIERTGYTGSAQVTVDIDKELTTATNTCYEWKGPVTVTWAENVWGSSNLTVKLIPTGDFSGDGDIVFRASNCAGATFSGTNLFTLSVSQKPTPEIGTLSIVDPEPTGETLYLSEGSNVTIRLNRDGNHDGTQKGRLTITGGTLPTNEVVWIDYDMTDKTVIWTLPTLGTALKKQDVRLLLSGLDGSPVDAAKSSLSVCVLPADAPKFETGLLEISAVQYAAIGTKQVGLLGGLPAGWEVKGVKSISGMLPAGLELGHTADGAIMVSGATAGVLSGESTLWLELSREDGSATYSYPVTIRVRVTALAEANPWFKASRTWMGLPICLATGDDEPISLRGALDLTITKEGRTSAKYRTLGNQTVSFAADGLTIGANNAATIEASTATGGRTWGLEVKLWPGTAETEHTTMDMQVMIEDPALSGQTVYSGYIGAPGAVTWSAEREDEIRPWAGIYSMAFPAEGTLGANTLCSGNPSVQVRFTSEPQWRMGRATYAGVLPNGRTFSGSATFTPAAEGFAELGLGMFSTSAADDFAAIVSITNAGEKGLSVGRAVIPSIWNHTERGFPQLSYSNAYTAVGSRFTATNDWEAVWGAERLTFGIDGELTDAGLVPDGWRIKSDHDALSAALNRNSGAMMGVIRECDDTAPVWHSRQWKGSALPGCEAFLLGAYWYNLQTNVWVNEREMRKTVRAGGSVEAAVEKK